MAFIGRWTTRSKIAEAARALDVRIPDVGRAKKTAAINPTNLRPWLQRWAAAGLVETQGSTGNWIIDVAAQHALLVRASARQEFLRLSLGAKRVCTDYSGERLEQAIRLALYTDDTAGLRELLGDVGRTRSSAAVAAELLLDTVRPESPAEAIAKIPAAFRGDYLHRALTWSIETGQRNRPDIVPLVDALTGPKAEPIRALAFTLHALHAVPYPGSLDPSHALSQEALAVAALVAGDFDAARTHARAAWTTSKRRGRKPRLEGPVAPLLTLLLGTGDSESRAVALSQCESPGRRSVETPEVYDHLSGFFGGPRGLGFVGLDSDWVCLLPALLVASVGDRSPVWRNLLDTVLREAKYQRTQGFPWVADQLEITAGALGASISAPNVAASLLDLLAVREPWEEALEALETQLGLLSAATPEAAEGERLVWFVELMSRPGEDVARFLDVSPKIQKPRGAGWTKGRPIALKRLLDGSRDEPWMTSKDQAVLSHIDVRRDWYGSTEYSFKQTTPIALIGHPRVFWAGTTTPVQVREGQARLLVEERDGQTQLGLDPKELEDARLLLRRRDATTLEVFDGAQLPKGIVQVLARGISVPATASTRLSAALTRLAPLFPIHGEVEPAVASEQVEADAQPVLELSRHQDGLAAEILVQPLGEEGPRFMPGQGPRQVVSRVGDRTLGCTRDLPAEAHELDALMRECPSLAAAEVQPPHRFINDLERSLELLDELSALPEEAAQVRWKEGDRFALVGRAQSDRFRLTIATADEWFSAQGEVEIDEDLVVGLRELLEALPRRRGRFVALDGDRYLSLTHELMARLQTLQGGLSSDDDSIQLHPALAGVVAGWAEEIGGLKLDRKAGRRLRRVKEAARLTPEVPSTFDGDLRGYQQEGFQWMQRLAHWGAGACLADDMGLGKTVQALAVLLARGPEGPALVVAPTSVCSGWVEQAARFAPSLRLHQHTGGDLGSLVEALTDHDVLVCSYTVMGLSIDELAEVEFATVVLDEAQAIKNPATQRAKAAHRLRAQFRLATTGTPIENHLFELWSLMQFLDPGLLGDEKGFERRFAKPIQRDGDEAALQTLRRIVSPFVLRRSKREVLQELPPRTELVLEVEPSPEEIAFTEALRQRALERIAAQKRPTKQATMHVLAELTRLRQAACAPDLVDPDLGIPSSKLDVFLELVEELVDGGHRALVFSQFVGFLTLAREALDARNVTYQYLDGSTPHRGREAAVRDFQKGAGHLFLISLKAGGTGLNLTAADYVIHLDPWWNPAVEDQASDRAHRIGQTRPVTVYRLVTKGTVEERVLALHGQKRDLADQLLDGRDDARPLDAEALLALLS